MWSSHAREERPHYVTRPRNGCEGDYRKHGIDAVFFFANNYSDISGSRPHKICLNLFQINWKGFIYSPLNNIFIGIFWNWCSFSLTKMQALVTISNHPFKKITLACIACLCFISTINGSLTTAFGSTAHATDNWPFQTGS